MTIAREYKEKILILAFNFIYNSKFFKIEKGEEILNYLEEFEENQKEIIMASSMIVIKVSKYYVSYASFFKETYTIMLKHFIFIFVILFL